ncbi:hypothetical protein Vadar_021184 [Vaccinium darrowii]|uniref:Uncharacterized protein n=1 Tax=Vaccinium darrowii TaxID=229202 RepID=A0ACB7X2Z8_9ERIC|nr:hypothetical protein Vadar_021184 [Vaccinium darrowii]
MEAGGGVGAENEQTDIIIVGGGICGLATALAFHRKGIENVVVLEKSDKLRATGAGIITQANGWRALDQLGVAAKLRNTAVPISNMVGETRCLRRSDLLQALADDLPLNTNQRFITPFYLLILTRPFILDISVVIGCDGVNSAVANFLGMKTTRLFSTCVVRDSMVSNDSKLIKQSSMETLTGFPQEELEMIRKSDPDHLFLTPLRYRAPWNLLLRRRFGEGSVAVAGDAMHAMGPFIAQGGAASLEDAVVLARCFAEMTSGIGIADRITSKEWNLRIEMAIDKYVKEWKMRVVKLSTETFLIGMILDSSWLPVKLICIALMAILFHHTHSHTLYDCGQL